MAFPDEAAALAALNSGTATPTDLREIVVSYPNLRPAVAAYPGTDDPMLGWLRDLEEPEVDAQLARRNQPPPGRAAPSAGESTAPIAAALGAAATTAPSTTAPTQPMPSVAPHGPQAPAAPTGAPLAAAAPAVTVVQPAATPMGPAVAYQAAPGGPGAPTGPAGPGSPGFGPATPSPGPRNGGSGLKIAIIVGVIVVLLAGGAFVAMAAGLLPSLNRGPATVPVTPPASVPPASPVDPGSPTPVEPPAAGLVCWDGVEIDDLADCTAPSTPDEAWAYLRYVYPSVDQHATCTQADSTGKSDYQGVTVMWNCELGKSLLRYRYWADPEDAERHYQRKFKNETAETFDVSIAGEPVEGWVKTSEEAIAKQNDGSKRYVATMWLPELQLSLSAEGNKPADMWDAFGLARIRPLDQVHGHQVGVEPDETPLTLAPH